MFLFVKGNYTLTEHLSGANLRRKYKSKYFFEVFDSTQTQFDVVLRFPTFKIFMHISLYYNDLF